MTGARNESVRAGASVGRRRLKILAALLLVVIVSCTLVAAWMHHHENRHVAAPEHDLSFSLIVTHYLTEAGSVSYRFEVFPSSDGGSYRSTYELHNHTFTHQGKLTAAQYDAFVTTLEESGLWDVQNNHLYDTRFPTYMIRANAGEREHTAVFTGLSTASQNSLQSYLMRSLPGRDLHALRQEAFQALQKPSMIISDM